MSPEEQNLDMLVAELDRENRLLRARNERLEKTISGVVTRLEDAIKGNSMPPEEVLEFVVSQAQ
jgi:hypothetical protein